MAIFVLLPMAQCGENWHETDSVINNDLGEDHLVQPDGTLYHNIMWVEDSDFVSGLTNIGEQFSTPEIGYQNGELKTISGSNSGAWYGYKRDSATSPYWSTDTSIISGLPSVGTFNTISFMDKDDIFLALTGGYDGTFNGLMYTGGAWTSYPAIANGLPDIGTRSTPEMFKINSTQYMISGDVGGLWRGFTWVSTLAIWHETPNVVKGLADVGTGSTCTIFENRGDTYLIAGSMIGSLTGYIWKDDEWVEEGYITAGTSSALSAYPDTISYSGITYMVIGDSSGDFNGYSQNMTAFVPIETGFTVAARDINATFHVDDFDTPTCAIDFTVTSGVIDWVQSTGLNPDTYYAVYRDGSIYSIKKTLSSEPTFQKDMPVGDYIISEFDFSNITGIDGFVYGGESGNHYVLPNVIVTINNNTWSDVVMSDDDGYYYMIGLGNDTYTLNFKKDRYDDILLQYVTPTNASMYYKDIYMQKSTGDYYSRHYTTFVLKSLTGKRFPNVLSTVYVGVHAYDSKSTGFDGTVTFHLFEDEEYKITFVNATQGVNEVLRIQPRDNRYVVYISSFSFVPTDENADHPTWWYVKNNINLTASWLNMSYKDTTHETTYLKYWINDTDGNIVFYNEWATPTATSNVFTHSQEVNSSNNTYFTHIEAYHSEFPDLMNTGNKAISFFTSKRINLNFEEQWQYTVVSILILIFAGMLFGATNAPKGALIICLSAWGLVFVQWLPSTIIGYAALVLATLLAIGWNLRKSEVVHT